MRTSPARSTLSLAPLALVAACGTEPGQLPSDVAVEARAHPLAHAQWSDPVWLGPVVNSPFRELNPALSPDELSLYFGSDRPGGLGGNDIYVSRRACRHCPWQPPVNLGHGINTSANDGAPSFSRDGRLLFFVSNRPGGEGSDDIYLSHRANSHDDFGWGPPVNLGPDVNTPQLETGSTYLQSAGGGAGTLYFSRGPSIPGSDIYYAAVTRNGHTRGPAVRIDEVSDPTVADLDPTLRADGREVIFWSTRAGGVGGADLWVSTRPSVHHPWSPPHNLGVPVNSPFADLTPRLSKDGRTLVFSAGQQRGGLGLQDIWMTTR